MMPDGDDDGAAPSGAPAGLKVDDVRVDRRSMLAGTGAATILAASNPAFATTTASPVKPLRIAVFDSRLPQSARFGLASAARSDQLVDLKHGLTRLWLTTLDPIWKEHPSCLTAGLTTAGVYHCLTEQARGLGLTARLIGRHWPGEKAGDFQHSLPHLQAQRTETLLASLGEAWPSAMVDVIDSAPRSRPQRAALRGLPRTRLHSPHLVSWIIG